MCGIAGSLAMDVTGAAPTPWLASGTRGSVGKPPRILMLVDHYFPAHKAGGPLRSVSNLVERLSDEFEFWVVTRDRDLCDAVPLLGIRAGVWSRSVRAMVYCAAPWGLSPAALRPAGEGLVVAGRAFLDEYEETLSRRGTSCAV